MHCPRDSFESIDLDLGDCIGVESCLDLKTDAYLDSGFGAHSGEGGSCSGGSDDQGLEETASGFPPPLPWLRCAENPPWIMKRYYTNDGRLIIRGEKIKRHEYFQADRSNGRLTLRLVPIIDDELVGDGSNKNGFVCSRVDSGELEADDHHGENGNNKNGIIGSRDIGELEADDHHHTENGNNKNGFIDNGERSDRNDGYDGENEDELALEEQEQQSRILDHAGLYTTENGAAVVGGFGGGGGGGGGREKFYKNCSMSRSDWMFGEIGVGVATIRSVHT